MTLAEDPPHHHHRRRRRSTSSRTRSLRISSKSSRNVKAPSLVAESSRPENIDALRAARLKYLATPPEERRKKMKYVGETVTKTKIVPVESKTETTRKRESRQSRPASRSQRRTSKTVTRKEDEGSDTEYVYGRPAQEQPDTNGKTTNRMSKPAKPQRTPTKRKLESSSSPRTTPSRRHTEPLRRRESTVVEDCDTRQEPTSELQTPALSSRLSVLRPPLRRSVTQNTPSSVTVANSITSTSNAKKQPSRLSNIFRASAPPTPEKKVSCLTCGSDVRISNTAKLSCTHRMCHSCLKRIFTMSVSDPAHMPPRCCTSDHIPLKHVDRIFDQHFKKVWNRKFQEYTTKNRIYCPSRHCGEWIKPEHIRMESGRKIGKCKRCGTKVCCICNNRAHTSRECPRDPETKRFVEVAKEKGWQRCYSCSAMVELAEGCNHMTCRCTAEFCIVCGLKWKTCDCPWFNYEQIDAHLGNPARYQEELDRRRDQERRDEAIARRMAVLGLGPDDHHHTAGDAAPRDDGLAGVFGLGNAAGHHLNANFIQQARDLMTANYQQAEQAARGLLNGLMTGRENPLPDGLPGAPEETAQILRRGHAARERRRGGGDPAEGQEQPTVHARVTTDRVAGEERSSATGRGLLPEGEGERGGEEQPRGAGGRPTRRRTVRRQSALADVLAGGGRSQSRAEAVQEARVREWAEGVG